MKNSLPIVIALIVLVVGIGAWVLSSTRSNQNDNANTNTTTTNSQPLTNTAPMAKNIVETAIEAGSFKTLVAAVQAADLVETLSGPGPFTVFAPTDEAFAKLPAGTLDALLADKQRLISVLTYHVVPGKVMAADVAELKSAKTVEGQSIAIDTSNGVKVDEANVVQTDIVTSNGIIHVIDAVLLP